MRLYIAISAFLLSSTAAYDGLRSTNASRHMSARKLDEVAANYGYEEVDSNTNVQDMEEKVEEMEEEIEEMEEEIEDEAADDNGKLMGL